MYQEKLSFAPGAEGLTFQCGDAVECHAGTCTCIQREETPKLVSEFASLKVWFAVNETKGPVREGNGKHHRLCDVVDELRRRGVLD